MRLLSLHLRNHIVSAGSKEIQRFRRIKKTYINAQYLKTDFSVSGTLYMDPPFVSLPCKDSRTITIDLGEFPPLARWHLFRCCSDGSESLPHIRHLWPFQGILCPALFSKLKEIATIFHLQPFAPKGPKALQSSEDGESLSHYLRACCVKGQHLERHLLGTQNKL